MFQKTYFLLVLFLILAVFCNSVVALALNCSVSSPAATYAHLLVQGAACAETVSLRKEWVWQKAPARWPVAANNYHSFISVAM